jgi:hypothetical protein
VRNNKFLGAIALILIALGLVLVYSDESKAAEQKVTKVFTGFAFEKSVVTTSMKKSISAWLNANPDYNMVTCVGYTGQNVKNRSKAFIQKLAATRSKNICDYINTKNDAITVQSTRGVPGNGKTADARKVTVTLIKVDGSEGGGGTVTVGVCDKSLTAVMRSRISSGMFYFGTISIRDIATSCRGKVVDVYFLDADGNQISVAVASTIYSSSITIGYSSFAPSIIESDRIKSVAFEIRDK